MERAGPVGAQQPGKPAIGEHPSAGLAVRAVVRFVVRIAYTENLRAAPPARFSVAPMNRHAFAKRRDLLREPRARLRRQAPDPQFQRAASRSEEAVPFVVRQPAGQSQWREPGGVENLVRVRVPDSADDAGIRQRPLQSPVFTDQRRAEAGQIGRENIDASRVHGEQAGLARHHVERCPPLAAGLCERERSRREIESRQILAPPEGRVGRPPMQAAGDHQVQHQPEVAIQADGDALSHSPQFANGSSRGFRERRRRGSKKKRAGQPDAFKRQPHHARFERCNVSRDVRQFGHTSPACMTPANLARPVGRPYEGEGTEPPAAPGSRRGRLRYGRADQGSETSVRPSVGAPLAKRSGPVNLRERRF